MHAPDIADPAWLSCVVDCSTRRSGADLHAHDARRSANSRPGERPIAARELGPLIALARKIANGYCRILPSHVEREDVRGAALLGLADALAKRPPDDPRPFGPYVNTRIRGAIIDYLRGIDPIGRDARAKMRTEGTDHPWMRVTFDFEAVIANEGKSPEEEAAEREEVRLFREAAERLPAQLAEVFALRLEGLMLSEIGERMGFTESRACQLWKEVVRGIGDEIGAAHREPLK